MECFKKIVNSFQLFFAKHSVLYVCQSSEYPSGLLTNKLFCHGSSRDTLECPIYYAPGNLKSYIKEQKIKENINERLNERLKKKDQLFNLMFLMFLHLILIFRCFFILMFLLLIFFISMSQTISVINGSGACFFYKHCTSSMCAGVCACNQMHQIENTESLE